MSDQKLSCGTCPEQFSQLAELKHQLSKQEIRVAMSPLVSSRLDQAFPACWEAWEEAVRREMWLVMDGVAGTGEPAVWKSAMGVNWQVSLWLTMT